MPARVFRFCITPVKGTALLHPADVSLDEAGIAENRRFHLVDERGELFSGHELGSLVKIQASWDIASETLTLVMPDGVQVSGSTEDLGEAVSTHFFKTRFVSGHIVEGPWAQVFSDYVGQPVRLARTDEAGTGPDVHPLTVVSNESVTELATQAGRTDDIDSRRFRINIELEGCRPHEEDSWDGHAVRVGQATLRILGQVPRCRVTTQDPNTGEKDFDALGEIVKYRPRIVGDGGIPFGVYALVETPGVASVGDLVELTSF
jgi:uncharacterized protein YcbX